MSDNAHNSRLQAIRERIEAKRSQMPVTQRPPKRSKKKVISVNPDAQEGSIEQLAAAELNEVTKSVRADRAAYAEYTKSTNDVKFYCCLVFQSETQKLEFLEKAGWFETMDYHNFDNMYLDGLEVAKRMNLEIPPIVFPGRKGYKFRGKPEFYRKEVIPDEN